MNKLEKGESISAASCINNLENGDFNLFEDAPSINNLKNCDLNLVNDNVDG